MAMQFKLDLTTRQRAARTWRLKYLAVLYCEMLGEVTEEACEELPDNMLLFLSYQIESLGFLYWLGIF